ncbi:MAG: SpoIIE family protein phosphatase [Bryobacteraceae bacterium]
MASPAAVLGPAVLIIAGSSPERTPVYLNQDSYSLGRASKNDLSFPGDDKLSRHHLIFERGTEGWTVRDLGSRNGTLVNGKPISHRVQLLDGDRIAAGRLIFTFFSNANIRPVPDPVVVVDDVNQGNSPVSTITTNLKSALEQPRVMPSSQASHIRALIHAGRELVSHRSVNELFQIILDIAVDAVNASRGVLMTRDDGKLIVRANHGEGFRISTAVVSCILDDRTSLLIQDASLDENLAQRDSIVGGQIRSILGVPLQTDDRAIGLIYVDSGNRVRPFTPDDLNLLTVMSNIAAIRIEHARLLDMERTQELLAHELQQAAEIQRGLLPAAAPECSNFDLAGYNAPCRTVGGDYFDFLPLSGGRLGIAIGDVAGKGMPAALLMSGLHARVGLILEDSASLADQVEKLNRSFSKTCPGNRFITFFVAVLDPATGEMSFCNAGHNPPFLLRAGGEVERLEATGTVLGLTPSTRFAEKRCRMDSGDVLALFSDGATEAANPGDDEEFGEDRLLSILRREREQPAAGIIEAINREIAKYTGGTPPADDITLAVVRRV